MKTKRYEAFTKDYNHATIMAYEPQQALVAAQRLFGDDLHHVECWETDGVLWPAVGWLGALAIGFLFWLGLIVLHVY